MSGYRPLSKRGTPDHDLDCLHDGVPPWMMEPVVTWLRPVFYDSRGISMTSRTQIIEAMEMEMRLAPFPREFGTETADAVLRLVRSNAQFALDVIDYALRFESTMSHRAGSLESVLVQCGSCWAVSAVSDEGGCQLTRRELEASKQAITDLRSVDQRAGDFLAEAWQSIASRNPDPAKAYERLVWAIEAAAKPVVSPANPKTTLGTVIRDLRSQKAKWTFALGSVDLPIEMADAVWTNHLRHGTQERPEHSLEEADAAAHLAIALVRFFLGGLVRRES